MTRVPSGRLRIATSGICCHCHKFIIEGKHGWREMLCVPKPLEKLYECTTGGSHGI